MTDNLKCYEGPKHGSNGNPDCSICWEMLEKLLQDKNMYMTGDSVNEG